MQLTYPLFLIGLLAVVIPVIIHLLSLRRPQRILFTNNSILREVQLVTVRHRRVQHLLILCTRVISVTALVLIFCQPFIPVALNKESGDVIGVNVLVDNSFSMQQQGADHDFLFGRAISEARILAQSDRSNGRIRLINSGSSFSSHTVFQAKLDKLKLTPHNSLSALNTGNVVNADEVNPLYIFSDFQKNTFAPALFHTFGPDKEVVLVPFVGQRIGNIYIDSLWLDDAFVRAKMNVGLHVRLRNGGGGIVANCPVKVFLGVQQVAAFQVSIGPGQTVVSVVQVQLNDGGLALGRVVTEDNPVTFDNTYYFTLQSAAAIRILEIGPEPVAKQLYENEPLFTYGFTTAQNVDFGAMRRANLVLLREVVELDAGLREGLRAVLKRGGSVVVVPSALAVGQGSYQQFFGDLGLGTVSWEAKAAVPELRDVAMPNVQEPFFRDVFGAQQRAVTMPRVAPVLRWSRTGTDILRMRDGESYLAEFASGAGRVYVFSAPFAKEYSDFVTHALFVPVMYRMAMLSYRNEQLPAYRLTQGAVSLPLQVVAVAASGASERADEAGFRFVKDSLVLIPAQRVLGQQVRLEIPEGMDAAGFYQVQRRGKVLTTLAFNPAKPESELAAYSADELRKMIGPNRPNIRVLDEGVGGTSLAKFRAEQTARPLWRYFLALALAGLLAEALLVRFGNRRPVENQRGGGVKDQGEGETPN